MVKEYADGERVPIRLVQENGNTIELDATSIDMVVERIQSNFGIPFMSAKKFGIDLNQAAVMFEVQGVFTDEAGQEATSGAVAHIDFHQSQWALPVKQKGKSAGQSSKGEEQRGTYTTSEEQESPSVGELNYQNLIKRNKPTVHQSITKTVRMVVPMFGLMEQMITSLNHLNLHLIPLHLLYLQ